MMKYLSNLNSWQQISLKVMGLLTQVLGLLSILDIHYKWLTASSINAFGAIIVAFGSFFVGTLAILINTYLTDRSKQKAKAVADEYTAKQKAEEEAAKQAELAELTSLKAKLDELQAHQASAQSTPSTDGPATSISTTTTQNL
jgi:uncharacterized membrane protein (DUF106 family)